MFLAIPAPVVPTLAIHDSDDLFPVHRIYCVGRNYAEHAKEMGHDPVKDPPFFFMKPADTVVKIDGPTPVDLPYPPMTDDYHYEVELVAALTLGGRDIPADRALGCIFGYAIGLDMTRRDLQTEAKNLRRPWELGKAADCSAPVGPLHLAEQVPYPLKGSISLSVDGVAKQQGNLSDMIWSVAEQVAYLSKYFEMKPGDLIFSGTPEGVGAVQRGQSMTARIDNLGEINLRVV